MWAFGVRWFTIVHSVFLIVWLDVSYATYPGEPTFGDHIVQQHLIVAASMNPLVKNDNLSLVSSGIFDGIVFNMLAECLNFSYEVRPPIDDLSTGTFLPNGSWTGNIGQIQRKEVDVCVSTSPPLTQKLHFSDISAPLLFVDSSIIIPFPREETKVWIITTVFTKEVWIAVAGTFVVMILSIWVVNKCTTSCPKRSDNSLSYWSYHFIACLAYQGVHLNNPSISFRLVAITVIFTTYITGNYFTASYTSFLSMPYYGVIANSIEDLANNKDIKTFLIKGSGTDQYFMSSSSPTIKKIGDEVRRHPERRIEKTNFTRDISTIVKDIAVMVSVKSNADSFVDQSYEYNNHTCKVTQAKETFFSRPLSYTFPKGSRLRKPFDNKILLLHQAGLIDYANRRSVINRKRCTLSEIKQLKSNNPTALMMSDMEGIFVIFGTGITLAILAFAAENVVAKLLKKK